MTELAEGARLEIVCAVKSGTEGSNPSLSASLQPKPGNPDSRLKQGNSRPRKMRPALPIRPPHFRVRLGKSYFLLQYRRFGLMMTIF
jgi:hypothetical protein